MNTLNRANEFCNLGKIKRGVERNFIADPVMEGVKFAFEDMMKKRKIEESSLYAGAMVTGISMLSNVANLLLLRYIENRQINLLHSK